MPLSRARSSGSHSFARIRSSDVSVISSSQSKHLSSPASSPSLCICVGPSSFGIRSLGRHSRTILATLSDCVSLAVQLGHKKSAATLRLAVGLPLGQLCLSLSLSLSLLCLALPLQDENGSLRTRSLADGSRRTDADKRSKRPQDLNPTCSQHSVRLNALLVPCLVHRAFEPC
jgi:hypothetical protein